MSLVKGIDHDLERERGARHDRQAYTPRLIVNIGDGLRDSRQELGVWAMGSQVGEEAVPWRKTCVLLLVRTDIGVFDA